MGLGHVHNLYVQNPYVLAKIQGCVGLAFILCKFGYRQRSIKVSCIQCYNVHTLGAQEVIQVDRAD